ncbi:MAG: peptide chain release factor N(5)-glutamine methyltransferase [Planctomycetes bacterium]|nr:peptide chain release factor N(5)-glutamine methyltransferase [Planctomycetota bacterium]
MSNTQCQTPPWTVARLLAWTRGHLEEKGVAEPRLSAELLLAHALDCRRIELYTHGEQIPSPDQLTTFRDLVCRSATHEPIAYLTGSKEFFSLAFEVTPDVLIPRPETETLVERVLAHCTERDRPDATLLDLGTGSGCVAIAILVNCPGVQMVASDISEAALAVARRNAETHGVLDRMRFVAAPGLDLPPEVVPAGGFDVIVSNPPYIGEAEMATLPANVRDHEPRVALTEGADGLSVYRILAEAGSAVLKPDGAVFVEIGADMGQAVCDVFAAGGQFEHVGTWHGGSDPHDRVLGFCRTD